MEIKTIGTANEIAFINTVNNNLPCDIKFTDRILTNVYKIENVSRKFTKNAKADVVLYHDGGSTPISIKKNNATRWASVDRKFGDLANQLFLEVMWDSAKYNIILEKLDNGANRINRRIARRMNDEQMHYTMFGSDLSNNGFILIGDFEELGCDFIDNVLHINARVISSIYDVKDTQLHPWMFIRNDRTRNCKSLPAGLKIEVVHQRLITKNTIIL